MTDTMAILMEAFNQVFLTYSWGHPIFAGLFLTFLFYMLCQEYDLGVSPVVIIFVGLGASIVPLLIPSTILVVLFLILGIIIYLAATKIFTNR